MSGNQTDSLHEPRVVLLGGAGYIGSVVCRQLADSGHNVIVVDDLIYRTDGLEPDLPGLFQRGDFRDPALLESVLEGADAVIHLGGLVGEPACAIDQELSIELNFASPVVAGEIAVRLGVPRFIFLSTCSVYGQQDGIVTEDTTPNPLSCYALTKQRAESRLSDLLAGRAEFTVLRLATVFGLSPRMRLDSVVNSMAARAARTGEIPLRGGEAWRPLVHVRDVAICVQRVVDGEVGDQLQSPFVFNVGNDANNHTIAEIADMVASRVPGTIIRVEKGGADHRDYRVSFARLQEMLPGACQTVVTTGIDEIVAATRAGRFPDADALEFDNLRGLQAAVSEGRVVSGGEGAMRRLRQEYCAAEADAYEARAAARYWGIERLAGVPAGDDAAADAAVLCKGKPSWVAAAYARWEMDCIDAMLPSLTSKRIADLGCGVGRLLVEVVERCSYIVGVDLAPEMVDRARRRVANFSHAEVLEGSVVEVPLPAGWVDVVLCIGVFEHVPAEHRRRALSEIARILAPGGQAVLELNNAESLLLVDAAGDNPYRCGRQLSNGYYCELVKPDEVLSAALNVGLALEQRTANPFYSAVRHAQDGSAEATTFFEQARRLDLAMGDSPALWRMADQHMVKFVKT